MYLLTRGAAASRAVLWAGLAAAALTAVGSIGLVVLYLAGIESAGFEFLALQFVGWVLQGVWLVGIGVLGLRAGTVRRRTSWAGIVAGAGSAGGILALVYSLAVGSDPVGQLSPAAGLAGVAYVVGFTLWALWLGGELRRRDAGSRAS